MGKLTFILGGSRSGKSSYALAQVREIGKPVTFIATATAGDDEMSQRIVRHQSERPPSWQTIEASTEIVIALDNAATINPVVILDCVTLLVSNLLMTFDDPKHVSMADFLAVIEGEISGLIEAIRRSDADWYVVSNEVGLGLVPAYKMGRDYRDGLGWANQRFAAQADHVIFMVAGLPMVVK
ncbi:MAG: bifunctional adenosylcobinamide kinase/adenosylcobinamide-phosphate guanylyltransferase [Anaerolineae bacterium]|jgi:adenosylcobinamide kinase/adenosylcobinamide-phosphate guanylyltransferase|nr:bifunctional adenosylcobinamide kinase/adenosylcobinamide-phosphate guanylyltransferase [Anaerolineae bacterium]